MTRAGENAFRVPAWAEPAVTDVEQFLDLFECESRRLRLPDEA